MRSRLGLTQAALAEAVGVAPNTLARWERGELGIPGWAAERLDAAARSGSSGSAVTRPRGVVLDRHHREIVEALNGALDPTVFEACAVDVLKDDWPRLVPVAGGGDDGFDGAVADGGRQEPFPLVVTTAEDLTGNLRQNLKRAQRKRATLDRALFATSRRVTPRMRQKLEAVAGELGVKLLQVYDQDWFAHRLYAERVWCKRLLRLTGRPRALSPFPVTRRRVLGDRVLGRERETRWLHERAGDCLLVGAPGSGKTFLLRALVLHGQALFKVDDDREQIASDLRSLKPPAVIIDDAHVDPEEVARFIQLRQEVGSDARIIATSWHGGAVAVQNALQIPSSEVLDLELIDADTMIEIIKSAGITGPDELLRIIHQQAAGRPGLAATLSHMCLAGDVRRAASGEGLVDQLVPQLSRMLDVQDATRLLAPFALGGDAGVRLERIAGQLHRPLDDISGHLARLAAAGIVMERRNRAVSVEPAPMRWVIVRRVFFGGTGSPDIAPFLSIVENEEEALDTLIGARSRGASVPDLEERLERAGSDRLWAAYASVGPSEARHAIERHPERILAIAEMALDNAPEPVIPMLLDCLHKGSARRFGSENPMEILNRWAIGVFPGSRNSIRRRSILVDMAMNWWQEHHHASTALRAMCIALHPGFGFLAPDPGNQYRGKIVRGHLGDDDLTMLTTFWPKVMDVLQGSKDVPWESLFQLVRAWRYLHPSSLADVEIAASTRNLTRQHAERMLRDLARTSRYSPGVQHTIREMGVRFGAEIETTTDRDFEELYLSVREVDHERDDELARRWRQRGVESVAASLAHVQIEAARAGLRYPPWRAFSLCGRLAEALPDAVASTEVFMKQGLPEGLVEPFLRKAANDGRPEWVSIVQRCLADDRYRAIGVAVTVGHPAPPQEVLSAALANAGNTGELVEDCCHRGFAPRSTVEAMLRWEDPRVAVSAAVGLWQAARQEGNSRVLDETWRQAILRAPAEGTGRSVHDDYWIGEILSTDSHLAEDWLRLKFGGNEHTLKFWMVEDAVTRIVPTLDTRQRKRVLMGLRKDPWNDDFVKLLVGDDGEIYRMVLDTDDLAPFHLAPLTGKPDDQAWRAKALLALKKKKTTEEIAQATLGRSHGWSGLESAMWAGWRRSFEALLDDGDRRIACIGQRGAEIVARYERQALERERHEAVHGR